MQRLLSIILLLTGIGVFSPAMEAQTCRVNAGSTANGERCYMEVYEYDFVNEKPCFPGGDRLLLTYINDTRVYPKEAYKKRVEGKVTCSFVVNSDGTISHVSVLRGVEPSLNQEAVRIISGMPTWTPGRHDGQAVPVRVIRSVSFRR